MKKEKKQITVKENLPFSNGKRILNSTLNSKSFIMSWGDVKIIINLGSACLSGLIGNSEDRSSINIALVSDSSPESSADIFSFFYYLWKNKKSNPSKPIYLFGYQGLNANLKLISQISLDRNSANDFGVLDYSGEIEHCFGGGMIIKTFALNKDASSVGFSIKSNGKKVSFIPSLDLRNLDILGPIKNSDCLIISDCKIKAEEINEFREFKRNFSIPDVLISANDYLDHLFKYKTVSFCKEGESHKIGEFVDTPSDYQSLGIKGISSEGFFVKVNPKDFCQEDFYLVPDRFGSTGIKDLYGKRIKFIQVSGQFKERFVGKKESLKESEIVVGKFKKQKTIDELFTILEPIRFFDLMYLISENLINKNNPIGFIMLDKFSNPQLVLLYPVPGEWEISDNVSEEELSSNINFISTVKNGKW